MLAQLTIRNFALVESLSLEFQAGFNALTGETGAGKSILIDALSAALGERAAPDVVRTGADRAQVEAVFEVGDYALPSVQDWAEDGQIILAREISAGGRSTFRINGRMCTAGALREVAADLIDIHGQHDHQSLLSPERHVAFLDAWAGPEVGELRRSAERLYADLRSARRELQGLLAGERQRVQQLDLWRFQVAEIEAARIRPGEEEELAAERTRLANSEKLAAAAAAAREALAADGGALDLLGSAAREAELLSGLDPRSADILEALATAAAAAEDAVTALRAYQDGLESDPERLEQVQERLETYRSLKRKYGDSASEVLAHRDAAAASLEALSQAEERREELEDRCARLVLQVDEAAQALFQARRSAAERFEQEIAGHLDDLSMTGTRFAVHIQPPPAASETGGTATSGPAVLGRAEFLISANPGEPLKPLARIASGGEMSRVMLALKTAMAGSHPVALIFDEIDAGVGGRTAEALGAKMARLGRSNQVLCVTHLPQIASLADRHFQVTKDTIGGRTVVDVRSLDGEARVGELARMLGGSEATAAQHARELLAASGR